jgi:hypothetical protein
LHQRAHGVHHLETRLGVSAPAQASAEYQPIELPVTATTTSTLRFDRQEIAQRRGIDQPAGIVAPRVARQTE